jgi:hypothetical protein
MRLMRDLPAFLPLAVGIVAACSGDAGAGKPAAWRLVEDLRIGGADTGVTSFNDIRGLAVARDGGIFVLDYQTQEIRLFDSTGRFVTLVARRGEGPGELAGANGMATGPDGALVVNDPRTRRFSVYDPGGAFVRQHTVPGWGYGYRWVGGIDTAGRVYEEFYLPNDTTRYVRRFTPDFSRTDTLTMPVCAPELKRSSYLWTVRDKGREIAHGVMGVPYSAERVGYVDAQGSVWCARSDRDDIAQLDLASRDTIRLIHGGRSAVPISPAQHDSAVASVKAFAKGMGPPDPDLSRIGSDLPIVRNLTTDDQGRLWVLAGTADTVSVYDVYAADGHPIATVRAGFAGTSDAGWHPVIRGDRFYTVTTDADGVPSVVRAHLVRTR